MLIYIQMIDSDADRSKFETIYLEHRQAMYCAAYHVLHNVQDAEDAVHYAFVKLAENMHKVGDPKHPKTLGYLVIITENRAIDIYRRKQAHPHVSYIEETVTASVEYESSNVLVDCIQKLPARERHIILLKYSHGYQLKEIAKMLKITYANALKIEQRAKARLKTYCEEAGIPC